MGVEGVVVFEGFQQEGVGYLLFLKVGEWHTKTILLSTLPLLHVLLPLLFVSQLSYVS